MSDPRGAMLERRVAQQFFGKYRGIVESNNDPLQLGRITARVPSVLGDAITDWAWPCVPWGGAHDMGFFFIPDVAANVWIEFEEGNVDHPVWVGTYWSQADGASGIPTPARDMEQEAPDRRVLRTRSGHVIELADVSGKESVTVRHKDGAVITFDEKGSALIANKNGSLLYMNADAGEVSLIDEHGNTIAMGSKGTTVVNTDGAVVDLAGSAVQVIADSVAIRSQSVSLGEGAFEPAILGTTFAAMYDAHTHMTIFGPTSPPIPAPMPLSVPTNPAISKSVKVK